MTEGFDCGSVEAHRDADGDGRSPPEQLESLEAARPIFGARSIGARVGEGMEKEWQGIEERNERQILLGLNREEAEHSRGAHLDSVAASSGAWQPDGAWCGRAGIRGVHAAWLEVTGGRASGRCGRSRKTRGELGALARETLGRKGAWLGEVGAAAWC